MHTNQVRTGLVLAAILALSDIAIVIPYFVVADGPPLGITIISVLLGVVSLALVAKAWTQASRKTMVALIVLRVVSGLGSVEGMLQDDAGVVAISAVFVVLTVLCLAMLRTAVRSGASATSGTPAM